MAPLGSLYFDGRFSKGLTNIDQAPNEDFSIADLSLLDGIAAFYATLFLTLNTQCANLKKCAKQPTSYSGSAALVREMTRQVISCFCLLFWVSVSLYALSSPTHAEDCECGSYETLPGTGPGDVLTLSEQVSGLGLAALHSEGRAFAIGADERSILRLKFSSDEIVPAKCRRKSKIPPMTLVLRGSLGFGGARDQYDNPNPLSAYDLISNMFVMACDPNSQAFSQAEGDPSQRPRAPSWCAWDGSASQRPNVSRFLNQPWDQIQKQVTDLIEIFSSIKPSPITPDYHPTDRDIRLATFYHNALFAGTGTATLNQLSLIRDTISTDDKLMLVQMFGASFNRNYDKARMDAGLKAKGVITLDQLLAAARYNTEHAAEFRMHDYLAALGVPTSDPLVAQKAGVCRDMASAQAEMLEALGMRNVYVVGYAKRGSFHTSAIAGDPANPKKVYKISYGGRQTSIGQEGAMALQQGKDDVALNYWLFKPKGRSVKNVTSEMGKFLAEASGFDVQEIEPLAHVNGSLAAANVALGNRWETRVFWGHDATGAMYLGGAADVNYGEDTIAPGKLGIAMGMQSRPSDAYFTNGNTNLDFLYLHFEQRLRTPGVRLGDISARIESTATTLFALTRLRNNEGSKDAIAVQGDVRLQAGLRLKQGDLDWNKRFTSTYFAGVELTEGTRDIRDPVYQGTVMLNHFLLTAEGRMRLSRTPEGRAYLVAATKVLVDYFGVRGGVEVGLMFDDLAVTLAAHGRLTGDAPYIEGSTRRVSAHANYRANRYSRFGLEAYRTFENDVFVPAVTGLTGSMIVNY